MDSYTYIRVFHSVPDAPPIDVYLNERPIVLGLMYKKFSGYLKVMPGPTDIRFYISGTRHNPILSTNLALPSLDIVTLMAVGNLEKVELLPIPEAGTCLDNVRVNLAFGHLSPNTPAVDVILPDGTVLFKNIGFKEVTNYIEFDPGIYNFNIRISGTDNIVLKLYDIKLSPKDFYSIYAIGLKEGSPLLEGILSVDRTCE